MKIKSVSIPDFLILKDFKIDFQEKKDFAIIIGDNGSGKSTLLEVIAYIFGHLHKYFVLGDKTAEFIDGYEITFTSIYETQVYDIYIKSIYVRQKTNTFKPIIKINDIEMSISQIEKEFGDFSNFLPSRIGVYYAGEAKYLRTLSEHFEEKFIKELIKDKNPYSLEPLNLPKERPFYYVKDVYLGLILLSLLVISDKDDEVKTFLLKLLGEIDFIDIEIEIILKKPIWAKSDKDTLWGINSTFVEQFVNKLNATSSDTKHNQEDNKILYIYYGLLDLVNLFSDSKDSDYAFTVLDTLFYNGLLDNISIKLKRTDGTEINSERLSEGQRQFIVTSGLSILWKDKVNKLFLYDEPDVFLHPKWQREFIPFIKPYFKDSFALLTTHNPSILSDVQKEQVHLFRDGKLIHKGLNTKGKNFDRLLIDYFGLKNTRSIEVSILFEKLYNLIRNGNFQSDDFNEDFKNLKNIVGAEDLDFLMLNLELKKANAKN